MASRGQAVVCSAWTPTSLRTGAGVELLPSRFVDGNVLLRFLLVQSAASCLQPAEVMDGLPWERLRLSQPVLLLNFLGTGAAPTRSYRSWAVPGASCCLIPVCLTSSGNCKPGREGAGPRATRVALNSAGFMFDQAC